VASHLNMMKPVASHLNMMKPMASHPNMMKFLVALKVTKISSSALQTFKCLVNLLYKSKVFTCQVKSACQIDSTGVAVEVVGESNGK
jgi:hypothetical protein